MSDPSSPTQPLTGLNPERVAERIERRLAQGAWEEQQLFERMDFSDAVRPTVPPASEEAAAEVATFALGLAGRRRVAKRGGRFSRTIAHFALAASIALTGVVAACGPTESPSISIDDLSKVEAKEGALTGTARTTPAMYQGMVLLDNSGKWATLLPASQLNQTDVSTTPPILVDREGSGLDTVGAVYDLAALPVNVGSRDGTAQFLDPLSTATQSSDPTLSVGAAQTRLAEKWSSDQRFEAVTRTLQGTPTVMDAAYNAKAAYDAGGTHTYADGVVLRLDPTNPVLEVIDKKLLESGQPTRAEDVVMVPIREGDRSLYEPGQVVTLKNVVMEQWESEEGGVKDTFYFANAALEGARAEPMGTVNLQQLLDQRLQKTDADLAIQAQELAAESQGAAATGSPTPGPTPTAAVVTQTVYRGSSFIDDYLMWRLLTGGNYFGGYRTNMSGPPSSTTRPQGDYYYTPPKSTTSATAGPDAPGSSRSTALTAARNSVSGQSAGTGGGIAATEKSAAAASSRVSAASSKAASIGGRASSESVGKSVSSVAPSTSSTAARSAGKTSAAAGKSSSVSSGSSGFGGKGISGGSSSG